MTQWITESWGTLLRRGTRLRKPTAAVFEEDDV